MTAEEQAIAEAADVEKKKAEAASAAAAELAKRKAEAEAKAKKEAAVTQADLADVERGIRADFVKLVPAAAAPAAKKSAGPLVGIVVGVVVLVLVVLGVAFFPKVKSAVETRRLKAVS